MKKARNSSIITKHIYFYRWSFLLLCCVCLCNCGKTSTLSERKHLTKPVRQLQGDIETILSDSLLAASNVGIKIVSLTTGEVLYEKDSDKLYHPASTMKLITAATALVKLKPNYRFDTTLYVDKLENNRISGNVYLKGRGDPLFHSDDLENMVEKLVEMGLQSVQGDIVVDESYFDDVRRGKGWAWDDGPISAYFSHFSNMRKGKGWIWDDRPTGGYYSQLSALTINHNSLLARISPGDKTGDPVQVYLEPPTRYMKIINEATTVPSSGKTLPKIERQEKPVEANVLTIRGSMGVGRAEISRRVDVVDPALYCGTLLKEMLAQKGVTLQGEVRYGQVSDDSTEIARHVSPPLSIVLWRMNKPSDNLIAELLLKTIAAEMKEPPGTGEKGIQIIKEFLNEIGLDTMRYVFADGSGVSRYNLVTASMLTDLLVYMFRNFEAMPEYLASLPVAGIDGTLKRRMKGMEAGGVLRAKTGTLRGVTALAGYTITADSEILAFAILMNNYVGYANPRRSLQDQIGDLLTQFSRVEP